LQWIRNENPELEMAGALPCAVWVAITSAGDETYTGGNKDSTSDRGSFQTWDSEEHEGQRFECKRADYSRADCEVCGDAGVCARGQARRPIEVTNDAKLEFILYSQTNGW